MATHYSLLNNQKRERLPLAGQTYATPTAGSLLEIWNTAISTLHVSASAFKLLPCYLFDR